MSRHLALTALASLWTFGGHVVSIPHLPRQHQNGSIAWTACEPYIVEMAKGVPVKCGTLQVPLDYSSTAARNLTSVHIVELIKVPAAVSSSKGTILFNFGGPGVEGIESLASAAEFYQNITGRQHDIISFNPRGTSKKHLRFSCYKTEEERALANIPNTYSVGLDASNTALGKAWAEAKVLADTCFENVGETGSLVGTASTARDAMQIVDAIGEGDLINYYGMSYGTALGATIAAMFPDRVGRMVLDGVLNPHEYWNSLADFGMSVYTDKAFSAFLEECVAAGPSSCPLAANNATAQAVESAIYAMLTTLRDSPIPLPPSLTNQTAFLARTTVDAAGLKNLIFASLYHPFIMPIMAVSLAGLLRAARDTDNPDPADLAAFAFWRNLESGIFSGVAQAEALQGIRCGDKRTRAPTLAGLRPTLERAGDGSVIGGLGPVQTLITLPCSRWRLDARERYEGDFRVKTKNPVLLVSSTHDPVTPLVSARNVSAGFEGSVVLERKGFGHTSISQASACSNKAIADYFINGTLPCPGKICETDAPVFYPLS